MTPLALPWWGRGVPELPTVRGWSRFAGPVLSVLLLAAIVWHFRTLDVARLGEFLPRSPGFWLVFAAFYLTTPTFEWAIYRRLWRVGPDALGVFMRKRVGNELLLGFAGELYLFGWARRHVRTDPAPFGAIKDVTILSGAAGNALTLLLLLATAPLLTGMSSTTILLSGGTLLALSLAVFVFRSRLFSLPRRELWIVGGIHGARIAATTLLTAWLWALLVPAVGLTTWLVLAALRLLVSRLPMLPNKDVLFAGLAAAFVADPRIAAVMTVMATLILATHLVVAAVLGGLGVIEARR